LDRKHTRQRRIVVLICCLLWIQPAAWAEEEPPLPVAELDEIVVTSQRREQAIVLHAGNIAQVDGRSLEWVKAQHIHEVMKRVAGAWVVRGSGQEHQTAIRSPVLGGGGACGGFLPLEDGIPVRPAGFCNINQFIELYSEEARAIEVIRGPGNALYGSNALHGTLNVLMPMPGRNNAPHLSLEAGANHFLRGSLLLPAAADAPWLAAATYAHDGGFRDDSGYDQGKLHLKRTWTGARDDFTLGLTATRLDQQSAGFIEGKDAYRDPTVNRTNPDPDAFRDAASQRLYGIWSRAAGRGDLDIRPYLRHSDMEFLHHQRPGKPVEENGHHSAGAMISLTTQSTNRLTIVGLDLDLSRSFLRQTQFGPTEGNPRQRETFPEGKHYDYEVDAVNLAAYAQFECVTSGRWTFGAGARLDYTRYDYDNRMLDGNTRDDGTPCGFGGCIYSRPTDRSDDFLNLVPNASAAYGLNESTSLFASLARGFRVPQALELYRLQSGQQVSDLDTETVDSLEVGLRTRQGRWFSEITAYAMRKRDSVFVDAEGFNVSGARSRHLGLEWQFDWRFHDAFLLHINAAYGRHTFDFDAQGRGAKFVSGNDIDSAPRWLGSAELRWEPAAPVRAGLQLTSLGEYYLDSLNRHTYPGHTLANLRAAWDFTSTATLFLRINNLADEDVADRANYAMNTYRYLPGRGREWFVELRYTPEPRGGW
jgi:outer membrane receptor protein involved in Fe transport